MIKQCSCTGDTIISDAAYGQSFHKIFCCCFFVVFLLFFNLVRLIIIYMSQRAGESKSVRGQCATDFYLHRIPHNSRMYG